MITYSNKSPGDLFTSSDANQIKEVVNENVEEISKSKGDIEDISLLLGNWFTGASDLEPYLSGDEYVLPAGLWVPLGGMDLGDKAIRVSTGARLRGFADAEITSSATGGVIRATNVDSPVILREFSVIATAGECLNVQGSTDHQFNAFFVGMFGVKAAIVNGFDVQSFKDCFTEAADGITCGGETNKIFIAQSPFYAITSGNAAIELSSDLDAKRIDIAYTWFKGIEGVGLRAQSGYDLEYGRFSNGMFEDVGQQLEGVEVEDLNWWFADNDGLENSRCIAGSRLSSPTTTEITSQNTWTPVQGTFTLSENSERFEINGDNELVYVGRDPIRVLATIAVASSPPASTTWQFGILKDGVINADSVITVVQGSGVAAQPRTATVVATLRLNTGDNFKLACRNNTNTSDLTKSNVSYAVSD